MKREKPYSSQDSAEHDQPAGKESEVRMKKQLREDPKLFRLLSEYLAEDIALLAAVHLPLLDNLEIQDEEVAVAVRVVR